MLYQRTNHIQVTPMMRYLFYSVVVTILDTAIVWILYRMLSVNIVTANSVGVVSGFILHYILSSKSVFQTEFGAAGFTIYLGTFFIGLMFADWLIYSGEHYLFYAFPEDLSFLFSKGISIVLPFFLLYFSRRLLFDLLKRRLLIDKQRH